ncbi:MAG: MFS transporter, partial [Verrucomicrobia bacterium]|nr:MFS transporter [Verrucomicrobiota bacterium]
PLIIKFALGLIMLALGFLILAAGARLVSDDTQVWPTWLIITYLVHTLGELCLSPVGLSTVSKLSPKRLVGQMMGIWFLASSLGNLIAGLVAGHISAEPQEKEPVAIIESADQGERLASTDAAQIAQNNVIEKQNLKDLLD